MATFRRGQRLVISPLQGLLPEKDGVSFATQAVGLGFVSPPLWGSKHSQPRIKHAPIEVPTYSTAFCDMTICGEQ